MTRPAVSILDHLMSPRNPGAMDDASGIGKASLSGNAPRVTIYVKIDGNRVTKATFQTFGCGYTIAACSVLTEVVANQLQEQAMALSKEDILTFLTGMPPEKEFCVELAIEALRDALKQSSGKTPPQ